MKSFYLAVGLRPVRPRAAVLAVAGGVGAVEPFEYPGDAFGSDSLAIVGDGDRQPVASRTQPSSTEPPGGVCRSAFSSRLPRTPPASPPRSCGKTSTGCCQSASTKPRDSGPPGVNGFVNETVRKA